METIALKRVYVPKNDNDGFRVLVDRLWPRGLKKEEAAIDLWLKDIGPSTDLRKWFHHEPEKWKEFSTRYMHELRRNPKVVDELKKCVIEHGKVTLVYAARDENLNNAVVLKAFLSEEEEKE